MNDKDFYFFCKDGLRTLHCRAFEGAGFQKHCFTTREGGVSRGHLATMNLSAARENVTNVDKNFKILSEKIGFSSRSMVLTAQTHTANVAYVDASHRGHGRYSPFADIDGLVTKETGICLVGFFADCVPILLADPRGRSVGVVHAGWRGTAQKIAAVAVQKMAARYGTDPADILCAIGPSIGPCCYEVGQEVAARFGRQLITKKGTDGKFMLDLWRANTEILLEAGVRQTHIYQANQCSCCYSNLYFSHRATGGRRGNIAALIEL